MEQFSFSFQFFKWKCPGTGGSQPCVNTVNLADEAVDLSLAMGVASCDCGYDGREEYRVTLTCHPRPFPASRYGLQCSWVRCAAVRTPRTF